MATVDLKAVDKQGIIEELVDLLVSGGAIPDRQAAIDAVLARERTMSTGMKFGIAIPHGKTATVSSMVACIGIARQPVQFDSLDGHPSDIFILTLSPPARSGPHLQFLAEVSRLFKSEDRRAAALAARTPEELVAAISD